MGGNGTFLASGGFSRQEYFSQKFIDGIKVIKHITNQNSGLPQYSNTPHTIYLHEDSKGHVNQIRFYRKRKARYDIDWGHAHGDLPLGEAHIHVWQYNKNGTMVRKTPRLLVPREKKLLEKLINKIRRGE